MPIDLDWEADGLYVRRHGRVRAQEVVEAADAIWRDARFIDTRYVLLDMSDVDSIDYSVDDIAGAVSTRIKLQKLNPRFVLLCASRDPVVSAIAAEEFNRRRFPFPTGFFPTVERARAWIRASLR